MEPHPLDPNFIDFGPWEHRVYGNKHLSEWALVDEEDYQWATHWCWCPKRDKRGKVYYRRSISTYDLTGQRTGAQSFYLHIEIMKRIMPQPSAKLCIVDHWNGNSLDNRRCNLRWATHSQNSYNVHGSAYRQGKLV